MNWFARKNNRRSALRYAQILGEIHATNALIAHYLGVLKGIDPNVDWWGYAHTKEEIKVLNEQLAHLTEGAEKVKPQGWEGA